MLGDTGLPAITSRITLNGFRTTIAGNNSTFRILLVTGSGKLTLNGLTITGGNTPGPGGGIFNLEGTLVLNHSRVTGNASAGGMMSAGGGIASGTLGTGPVGTAVLNFSRVDHNTTSGSAGGILNHGGTLILNASKVDDNTAAGGGGGIASGTGGQGGPGSSILVVKFSQINGNTANGGPMAGAGGIANGGTATITASEVEGNTAPGAAGGGILNHGVMTITGSKVTGNTAPADSAGDQGMGGGIANINLGPVAPGAVNGGILTITFSQISRNTASGQGGGIVEATITRQRPGRGRPADHQVQPGHPQQGRPGRRHLRRPRQPGNPQVHRGRQEHPRQLRPARNHRGLQELRTRSRPGIGNPLPDSRPEASSSSRRPPTGTAGRHVPAYHAMQVTCL